MEQFPTLVLPRFIRVPFTEPDPWDQVPRSTSGATREAQPAESADDDAGAPHA